MVAAGGAHHRSCRRRGLSWYIRAVWLEGQEIGERRERRRWQALNGAEAWVKYFDELGDKAAAENWRKEAARLRSEVEPKPTPQKGERGES